MKLVFDSTFEGIATRVDGSLKITLSTQEMDAQQAGLLLTLRNKFVKVLLSDSNITALQEEAIDSTPIVDAGKKSKTPSQRLRAVLYRLHEQEKPDVDFDTYYSAKMNSLIDHFKTKLQ